MSHTLTGLRPYAWVTLMLHIRTGTHADKSNLKRENTRQIHILTEDEEDGDNAEILIYATHTTVYLVYFVFFI